MSAGLALPRGRSLLLEPFAVMGVINVTPDSFFAPSRREAALAARDRALEMAASGAALLDIGGESTRPGSDYVGAEEELERVIPAIRAIRAESDIPLSVDTRKAVVAEAALDAGADIVNDVSALRHDPAMAALAAARGVPVILMHMKGDPKTMQAAPSYADCPAEVLAFLAEAARDAMAAGIPASRIVLDPGIGFGKRLEDNLALLSRLGELAALGHPLLVGLSRKAFVGALTGHPAEGRLAGSLGAACAAWLRGARLFRVHDVPETVDALGLLAACLSGGAPRGAFPRSAASPAPARKGG
jgi:dihydropteroate synthase